MDLVSAANLIPGPNSTELVIHIGLQRAGYAGMLVAGLCFIAPAMFSVLVLAAAYVRFRSLPAALACSRWWWRWWRTRCWGWGAQRCGAGKRC